MEYRIVDDLAGENGVSEGEKVIKTPLNHVVSGNVDFEAGNPV
jgi:hypothetical protein